VAFVLPSGQTLVESRSGTTIGAHWRSRFPCRQISCRQEIFGGCWLETRPQDSQACAVKLKNGRNSSFNAYDSTWPATGLSGFDRSKLEASLLVSSAAVGKVWLSLRKEIVIPA